MTTVMHERRGAHELPQRAGRGDLITERAKETDGNKDLHPAGNHDADDPGQVGGVDRVALAPLSRRAARKSGKDRW